MKKIFYKTLPILYITAVMLLIYLLYYTCYLKIGGSIFYFSLILIGYLFYAYIFYFLAFRNNKANKILIFMNSIFMLIIFIIAFATDYYGRTEKLLYDKNWFLMLDSFKNISVFIFIYFIVQAFKKSEESSKEKQ